MIHKEGFHDLQVCPLGPLGPTAFSFSLLIVNGNSSLSSRNGSTCFKSFKMQNQGKPGDSSHTATLLGKNLFFSGGVGVKVWEVTLINTLLLMCSCIVLFFIIHAQFIYLYFLFFIFFTEVCTSYRKGPISSFVIFVKLNV